jgi:hypothetical protein
MSDHKKYLGLPTEQRKMLLHHDCCEQMTCKTKSEWLRSKGLPSCPADEGDKPFPVFGNIKHMEKISKNLYYGVY